jgi:hypothetical protein
VLREECLPQPEAGFEMADARLPVVQQRPQDVEAHRMAEHTK